MRRLAAFCAFSILLTNGCNAAATSSVVPAPTATQPAPTLLPTETVTTLPTQDLAREAQQAALLFSQDFESGSLEGLHILDKAQWDVVKEASGNSILCNQKIDEWLTVEFGSELWRDYAVEMRTNMTTVYSISSILARADRYTEGYHGQLVYDDQFANLVYGPTAHVFGESQFHARRNFWHTFRMEAAGNKIRFLIDGQLIGEAIDTQRPQGKAGFGTSPRAVLCVDDIRVWALSLDGQIDQPIARPSAAPKSLSERLGSHTFPKLFLISQDNDPPADPLAQYPNWDLLLVTPEFAVSEWLMLGPSGLIRSHNPNAVVLVMKSVQEFNPRARAQTTTAFISQLKPEWAMKDVHGDPYPIFYYQDSGSWSIMLNLSTDVNTFIPNYMNEAAMKGGLFDGIFYDGTTEKWWLATRTDHPPSGPVDSNGDGKGDTTAELEAAMNGGLRTLLAETRRIFPTGSLITGNGGWDGGLRLEENAKSDTILANLLNGRQIEGFLHWEDHGIDWMKSMRAYYLIQQASLEPKMPLMLAYCTGEDYDHLRYVLASSLMFDGYFACSNPQDPDAWGGYEATWWYDEYSVDFSTGKAEQSLSAKGYLGMPQGPAYNVADKNETLAALLVDNDKRAKKLVWRRDFQNGIVLLNPSGVSAQVDLVGTYRKILGEHDPAFNDGSELTEIVLPAKGGVILLNLP